MLLYFMKNRPRLIPALSLPFLKSLALVGVIVGLTSAATAQNRYQITRIPVAEGNNSAALGLNNKGEVVGYSFQGDDYQAFLYSASDRSMTDIGSLGGKLNAACAISDAGQVAGYSQDQNGNLLAFVFSRNAPITSLGTLEGSSTSEAFGINNSGAVVGDSQSGNQSHRPVLFSNNSVQDLGLGGSNEPDALETAYAINDSGQIVGRHSAGNSAFHAFLHSKGNTTDFGTLGGANGEALAINKKGQAVGDSETADGVTHAFLFDGSLKDLGTLPGYDNASYARGINNAGDIVGESDSADQKRAFVYSKGQLIQLDKVAGNLNESGFASLDVAYGINDQGWIVGYGTTTDNLTAAFVAVPETGHTKLAQGGNAPPPQAVPQGQPRGQAEQVSESDTDDYDVFYSRLSGDEGNWVEAGNYGYCFRPKVDPDWRPYRDGHWVWTDRGWYWDSDERFSWATYHYGRWVHIGGTGWCWVPGHQWAPAWVSWRESDSHVGWAPLPPEADVSVHVGISSWSDSYYDIGPAAYTFISYSHWSEPRYTRFIEPPDRNVQIINETRNVTNIVTNNNVINNFGPPVQTVAARSNRNIQQVRLAVNPATGPNANYGQALQGNQLNVVAPPTTLKAQAVRTPPVQTRIANPQVEKGWQGVNPTEADKLKKTIAQQNPVPKDLPKPTPFATPQIGSKGQAASLPATGSPAPVPGQKQTPANLVKPTGSPGGKPPTANVKPGGSPAASPGGNRSVPPNLIGAKPSGKPGASPLTKPSGTPGASPGVKPAGTPGASPTPAGQTSPAAAGAKQSPAGQKPAPTGALPGGTPGAPKSTPPNLNAPKTSPETKPATSPKPGGGQPEQGPRPSATPRVLPTPTTEKKSQSTPTPPPRQPANVITPKPMPNQPATEEAPKPAVTPRQPTKQETPKPTPRRESTNQEGPKPAVSPRHESTNEGTPKSNPEVKSTPRAAAQEQKPPISRPPAEKKPEQTHPNAGPHKTEGGGKEEGKRGKPTPTP
jgi:probable HAF family extracellular repeat protein